MDSYAELSADVSYEIGDYDGFIGDATVDIDLSVNAQSDMSFGDTGSSKTETLYSQVWPLWSQSFGSQRREYARDIPHVLQRRGVTCGVVFGNYERISLVNENVSGEE